MLRRCSPKAQKEKQVSGLIELDLKSKTALLSGKPLLMTQKEFDLLAFFVANPHEVLTRNQILNAIWNYDYEGDPRTVDTHVKQLRAKLGEAGGYIRTVHGRGYLYDDPDR